MSDLFSIKQVAQKCRVSEMTVYNWIKRGYLSTVYTKPNMHERRGLRVREEDLNEFLRTNPRYNVYTYEDDRETRILSKRNMDTLRNTLGKMYEAREVLDRDIRNLEVIIERMES